MKPDKKEVTPKVPTRQEQVNYIANYILKESDQPVSDIELLIEKAYNPTGIYFDTMALDLDWEGVL